LTKTLTDIILYFRLGVKAPRGDWTALDEKKKLFTIASLFSRGLEINSNKYVHF